MRKKERTIILAKVRNLIRIKSRRYNLGDEMDSLHFWSNDNYERSSKVSKKKIKIGNYPYYSKSTKAIEALAEEIYNIIKGIDKSEMGWKVIRKWIPGRYVKKYGKRRHVRGHYRHIKIWTSIKSK